MEPTSGEPDVVLRVTCAAGVAELVADRMLQSGASAVAEEDVAGADRDGRSDRHGGDRPVSLVGDVAAGAVVSLREFVDSLDPDAGIEVLRPGGDHLDAWRPFATAVDAGPFLVRPPWIEVEPDTARIEVVVDPGHTFGSGSHPTTRSCLEAIGDIARWMNPTGETGPARDVHPTEREDAVARSSERRGHSGWSVLDVGCGSGVLAVAALLAGAGRAVGVDIDDAAGVTSEEVARRNGVADRYRFEAGGLPALLERGETFDLVVANLLVPVIEDLGADLVSLCAPGARLVLSGLLGDQCDRALHAVGMPADAGGSGTTPVDRYVRDGWHTLSTRPVQA
ncbi:MAG: 50S ribosomal protein L11 methyltransferase [Microthrixaceae bacterium]|nr:50S ribosomal protein L11 methyltransferase [Microthrixaceae bacterium]